MRRLILTTILLIIGFTQVLSQSTRGSLTGTVNDKTGATIPDTTVVIKNNATGEDSTARVDSQGTFVFPSLAPGQYTVKVEAKGFKRAEFTDVTIDVSTPAKLNVSLEVGDVSEAVVVSGDSQEIINSSSATLTNVVNPRQLQDLPLPSRNPVDFADRKTHV